MSNELIHDGSYEQKLAMVAAELMDPKEIGLTTAEEAQLKVLDKEPPQPLLQDFLTFEASEVPQQLRAQWALKDQTIIPDQPDSWKADWIEENKNSHRIQAHLRCGTAHLVLDQTYGDVVLGFARLMETAAELVRKQYALQTAKTVDVESAVVPASGDEKTPTPELES